MKEFLIGSSASLRAESATNLNNNQQVTIYNNGIERFSKQWKT